MALDSTRVISGSYGEVWHDGQWMTNITGCEANVEIEKEDILRSGTQWRGHKVMGLNGTGTLTGYMVTSDFLEKISSVATGGKEFVTEVIVALKDPDAYGNYRVRLKNVTFDSIPLVNFTVGEVVEQELPFTFSGFEFMDKVKAN